MAVLKIGFRRGRLRCLQTSLLALLVLTFLVTAAPGAGGGGGFGGGGMGGSFGSRGGSGSMRRGDPRYAASLLSLCSALIAGTAFVALWQLADRRYRVVEVVIVVREGSRYVSQLDALLERRLFDTPSGRGRALATLRKLICPADITFGFVTVHGKPNRNHTELHRQAAAVYQRRMTALGLVERPGSEIIALRRAGILPKRGDACLIGIVAGVGALTPVAAGGIIQTKLLLESWGRSPVYQHPFLYVYYAPDPDRRLTHEAAETLFHGLQADQAIAPPPQ